MPWALMHPHTITEACFCNFRWYGWSFSSLLQSDVRFSQKQAEMWTRFHCLSVHLRWLQLCSTGLVQSLNMVWNMWPGMTVTSAPVSILNFSFLFLILILSSALPSSPQPTGLGQDTKMAMAEAWFCFQLTIFVLILWRYAGEGCQWPARWGRGQLHSA